MLERYNSDTILYVRSISIYFIKDLCSCSLLREFSWLNSLIRLNHSLQGKQMIIWEHGIIWAWCANYFKKNKSNLIPMILHCTRLVHLENQCLSFFYGICCVISLAEDQEMIIVRHAFRIIIFKFDPPRQVLDELI